MRRAVIQGVHKSSANTWQPLLFTMLQNELEVHTCLSLHRLWNHFEQWYVNSEPNSDFRNKYSQHALETTDFWAAWGSSSWKVAESEATSKKLLARHAKDIKEGGCGAVILKARITFVNHLQNRKQKSLRLCLCVLNEVLDRAIVVKNLWNKFDSFLPSQHIF